MNTILKSQNVSSSVKERIHTAVIRPRVTYECKIKGDIGNNGQESSEKKVMKRKRKR